nr:hypothetical protein [uncultured Steroidobacter sp.]
MTQDTLAASLLSSALVLVGFGLLVAPLGTSFMLGVLFAGLALLFVLIFPPQQPAPWGWLVPSVLFVAFLIVNAVAAGFSMTASGAQPFQAALVLALSVLVNAVSFIFGQTRVRTVLRITVLFMLLRAVTSAAIPWTSVALLPFLDGLYNYEDYGVLGIGVRYIVPGDITILAGWLILMTTTIVTRLRGTLRLLIWFAAIASLSRFVVAALILLEFTRLVILSIKQGRWSVILGFATAGLALVWLWFGYVAVNSNVMDFVEARVVAASSNDEKVLQYTLFGDAVLGNWDTMLFGAGVGEHLELYIRDPDHPFQYEAQVPSFAYQLGIPGVCLWIAAIVAPFLVVAKSIPPQVNHTTAASFILVALAMLIVAGGFTNPSLMLPQNAILFAALGGIYAANNTRPTITSDTTAPPEGATPVETALSSNFRGSL